MKFFDEYTSKYDMNVEQLKYKYDHSYRVMDNMIIIAKELGLTQEDIELAKCIGLLHDISRFYQFTKYKTFSDKFLDHGNYSVEIIKKENALKYFNVKEEDYNVVYKSIMNHNKYSIESGLTERELLFSKMIRDADKLDILYSLSLSGLEQIFHVDNSIINDKLKNDFYNNKMLDYNDIKTNNDNILTILAYPYDIYLDISLKIIINNNYYEKIYNKLKNKEIFKEYFEYIKKYIEERVD